MKIMTAGLSLLLTAALWAPPASAQSREPMLQFQLSEQLKQSAQAWNRGDLEAFLGDYLPSEELTFASSGRILKGFDALAERYRKSYGESPEKMGKLSFREIEVWRLAPERALVLGRWKLDYPESSQHPSSEGVFSLVMIEQDRVWRIFHDHTSLGVAR